MGCFLLAAGEPGMRIALPNARIMVHQPSGGARGMASDIEIQAREILRIRTADERTLRQVHRQDPDDIEKAMDRDTFLDADEAPRRSAWSTRCSKAAPKAKCRRRQGSGGAPNSAAQGIINLGASGQCKFRRAMTQD